MKRFKRLLFYTLLVMVVFLTGCEKDTTVSDDTTTTTTTEKETESTTPFETTTPVETTTPAETTTPVETTTETTTVTETTSGTIDTSAWTKVTHDNYSILVADGWLPGTAAGFDITYVHEKSLNDDWNECFTIVAQDLTGSNLDLESYKELSLNQLTAAGYTVVLYDKTSVGGMDGYYFLTSANAANISGNTVAILCLQYFTVDGNTAYLLSFNASADCFSDLEPEVIAMFDSFIIDKKQASGENEGSAGTISNWKDYAVIVNGLKVTLPYPYKELNALTGLTMKEVDLLSPLEASKYTIANLYNNDGKLNLYVNIANYSETDIKNYSDCDVTRISQTQYQLKQNAPVVTFPYDLQVGQSYTAEQLIALIGEPSKKNEYKSDDSTYTSITLRWCADETWTTRNYFEIKIVNGLIDEITLDAINK